MSWWTEKRFRMIQNNLRDIDAGMDVEAYVETLKEFGANVCMVGCGGITAFHPTRLECQKTSPYLKDDFFGNLLRRCHENGIRVIARFDFSKTHIQFLTTHPEWFSKSIQGEPVLYNDTAAACVNGPYQQECSLQILEEVISNYPVDGVFFNMFGYQTRDYSGRYVGICQCESCRNRFALYSGGMELPTQENEEDPVYRKYQEFRKFTTQDLLEKIYRKVKELNPETAVCTYSSRHVDLVRSESNSAVDRPLPFWAMESESNVSFVQETFNNRFSSNCVINAVDIFYRFMGVSPYLNELRLYGDMAAGGNLDWCIIGGFETYPDKMNFEGTKRVFRFHKKYEDIFSSLQPCGEILLVNPAGDGEDARKEYLGIYKMLKEAHLPFEVMDGRETELLAEKADAYRVIILPGIKELPIKAAQALEKSGAVIIGTGLALEKDGALLKKLFSVTLKEKLEPVRGSYMLTEPKSVFRHFGERDWVYLDKEYRYMEPEEGNRNYMPLISASMYGPPERCFGHEVTEQSCVSIREGKSVYFPWMPGQLYYSQGYEDFKNLFLDVLWKDGLQREPGQGGLISVEAPSCAEVLFHRCGEDKYLLQILNYSGFNGTTFSEPLPLEARFTFPGLEVKKAQCLEADGKRKIACDGKLKVPVKGLYKAVLITAKER